MPKTAKASAASLRPRNIPANAGEQLETAADSYGAINQNTRGPYKTIAWMRSSLPSEQGVAELRKEWDTEWADKPMPPPPPGVYRSRDDGVAAAKAFGLEHGYKVVIGGVYKQTPGGETHKVRMHCSHSTVHKPWRPVAPEDRVRNRFSRKTGCPFRLRLMKRKWIDEWILSVTEGRHNHMPDTSKPSLNQPSSHPDLDALLYEWYLAETSNGEVVHGAKIKSRGMAFFAELPQFRGRTPPEFDRAWLDAWRARHGIPYKPAAPSGPPVLIDLDDREAVAAMNQNGTSPPSREELAFNGVIETFGDDLELIVKVKDAVKAYMSRYDASHDWDHILRVLSLAKKMVTQESQPRGPLPIDPKTVYLAAICHDLGDQKYAKPGENVDNQIAELLLEHGASPDLALKVQLIAKNVSFSNEIKNGRLVNAVLQQHPELRIVQDADRLDAIGAIGIGRTFVFTGAKGAGRGMMDTIEHFTDKLERLGTMMKTETGRQMARERTQRLQTFRSWWADEYEIL